MPPRVLAETPTILSLLSRGEALNRLNEKLVEVFDALNQHPDDTVKGSLSLTLAFKTARADDGSTRIGVLPEITIKLPKERGFKETTFFLVEGGLSLEHPRQFDLFPSPKEVGKTG